MTAERYGRVQYLTQPIQMKSFQALIHLLPPSSVVPLLGPFDRLTWQLVLIAFLIYCILMSIRAKSGIRASVAIMADSVYVVPLLQGYQHTWYSRHNNILLMFYCLCSRLGLCLYSAMLINLLAQSYNQRFSTKVVLDAIRNGKYHMVLAKNSYTAAVLTNDDNNTGFYRLRDVIRDNPPKVFRL